MKDDIAECRQAIATIERLLAETIPLQFRHTRDMAQLGPANHALVKARAAFAAAAGIDLPPFPGDQA